MIASAPIARAIAGSKSRANLRGLAGQSADEWALARAFMIANVESIDRVASSRSILWAKWSYLLVCCAPAVVRR
jgi:hypothetical protein